MLEAFCIVKDIRAIGDLQLRYASDRVIDELGAFTNNRQLGIGIGAQLRFVIHGKRLCAQPDALIRHPLKRLFVEQLTVFNHLNACIDRPVYRPWRIGVNRDVSPPSQSLHPPQPAIPRGCIVTT